MKTEQIYQICYTGETISCKWISNLFVKPSDEELAQRTQEDFDENAINWNLELLEESSWNGKWSFCSDCGYYEGTLSELMQFAEELQEHSNYDMRKLGYDLVDKINEER